MDIDTLDLIDQYLRGTLSETEKKAFEKRIAWLPDCEFGWLLQEFQPL